MNQDSNYSVQNSLIDIVEKLYPLCRSITGSGTRETLREIQKYIPLNIHEIPTGTKVFDWEIPKEWNISDAFVKDSKGNRVIDFKVSNLHVVNYSTPVNKKLSLTELKKHLFTLQELPDLVPYRTTYYKDDWGFCLSHNDFLQLKDDIYHVVIDSQLTDGSLTYAEYFKEGKKEEEVLISTHICHPSMCNDNLSGISIATHLAKYLNNIDTYYSYRILFIPATIGAITWLALNQEKYEKIKYGLVLALLGDNGKFHYKRSRNGNAVIDRVTEYFLQNSDSKYKIMDFQPYGYDERQFCSPGINLPVGRLTRTPNKEFKEYHTSGDNQDFISKEQLYESYELLVNLTKIIDSNQKFINLYPKCEPQLGKRGLYSSVAGNIKEIELAMLWILNYSDGENDLVDIALKSGIDYTILVSVAEKLLEHSIIKKI